MEREKIVITSEGFTTFGDISYEDFENMVCVAMMTIVDETVEKQNAECYFRFPDKKRERRLLAMSTLAKFITAFDKAFGGILDGLSAYLIEKEGREN